MLNNLTIGIPFHSRGSKIRIKNLNSVLKHIEKLNTNIIVFEQDDKVYLNQICKQYPNIIFHFEYKKEDYFDRTKIINNIIRIIFEDIKFMKKNELTQYIKNKLL